MRLIDADAITTDFVVTNEATNAIRLYISYNQLKNAPTIDPVKHGRWIEQEHGDWRFSKEFRCSECGKYRLVTYPAGWEWNFCPHCGAKMDEVSE